MRNFLLPVAWCSTSLFTDPTPTLLASLTLHHKQFDKDILRKCANVTNVCNPKQENWIFMCLAKSLSYVRIYSAISAFLMMENNSGNPLNWWISQPVLRVSRVSFLSTRRGTHTSRVHSAPKGTQGAAWQPGYRTPTMHKDCLSEISNFRELMCLLKICIIATCAILINKSSSK